jgi:hypothetical protein
MIYDVGAHRAVVLADDDPAFPLRQSKGVRVEAAQRQVLRVADVGGLEDAVHQRAVPMQRVQETVAQVFVEGEGVPPYLLTHTHTVAMAFRQSTPRGSILGSDPCRR